MIDKSYLTPFLPSNEKANTGLVVINLKLFKCIDRNDLWCPEYPCTREEWITELVCSLLKVFTEKSFLPNLIPVCKVKVNIK